LKFAKLELVICLIQGNTQTTLTKIIGKFGEKYGFFSNLKLGKNPDFPHDICQSVKCSISLITRYNHRTWNFVSGLHTFPSNNKQSYSAVPIYRLGGKC